MATTAYTSSYTGVQIDAAIAAISGKADKVTIVNHGTSDTTYALTPNVWHVWGTVTSLTLTFATPSDNTIVNMYMFEFTSGSTPTNLGLPQEVVWANDSAPTMTANTFYEVTIKNNCAKISAFPLSQGD